MNKLKIIKLMLAEKKSRWRYLYLTLYAMGCYELPHFLSTRISQSNKVELERNGVLPINLITYDGSGQAVHPDLLIRKGKIWLVCTPYPYSIESYENPCVYYGDTIYDMKPIDSKPLAYQEYRRRGNHISDPCIFEDADHIYVLYRDTININGIITQKLYLSLSTDGEKWQKPWLLFESKENSYISPAVLKYEDDFVMYYIQLSDSQNGGDIHRVELSKNFAVQKESVVKCWNLPHNMVVWHIGLTFDDFTKSYSETDGNSEGVTGVFVLRDKDDVTQYALYWAHADSVHSEWVIGEEIIIPEYLERHMKNIYKSAIIPNTGEILLSYNDNDYRWNFAVLPGKNANIKRNDPFASYVVFSRVFRKNMTYARFLYKHQDNPTLLENFCFRKYDDLAVIGTNCFDGAIVVSTERQFKVAQSCDTAVIPEARGRGIFTSLILEAEKRLKEEGVEMMLGFPNNNSYHGFIKMGWKHIGNFLPWVKLTRPLDLILDKVLNISKSYGLLKKPLIREYLKKHQITDVELYDKCPFTGKDYQIINEDVFLKIKRSAEYYRWKCDGNKSFFYYVMRGTDRLSYFIFEVNPKGRIMVADFFFSEKSEKYKKACFQNFASDVKKMGNAIVFPMIREQSIEERLLRNIGFIRGDKSIFGFHVARMIVHNLSTDSLKETECIDNWYISPLDVDTIIS